MLYDEYNEMDEGVIPDEDLESPEEEEGEAL